MSEGKKKEKKITSARITLTGALSMAVGRFRFIKGRPIVTDDAKVIAYVRYDANYRLQDLSDAKKEKKAPPAKAPPASPSPQLAPAPAPQPAPPQPEPVTGEDEGEEGNEESPPVLTRKSEGGDA